MRSEHNQKVSSGHLTRKAFLYIRQSTMRQVIENTESTKRQYAMKNRAISLGWTEEDIIIIDNDLGQSGASANDRQGFQKLVTEVGMGHAGMVMGLEVSRLARNCTDWHRLLEICALTHTLILDEDGLYDPSQYNDRLLLGLKGTMSEAELHLIRARLQGGILNKARRGELKMRLPVGLEYDLRDKVLLNSDLQVQQSHRVLFETFNRVGSANGTVKFFRKQKLKFPKKVHCGPEKGRIVWRPLTKSRAVEILHNPRLAGAFAYGRRTERKMGLEGKIVVEHLPPEKWPSLIRNAHAGYISWEQYEKNQTVLEANHVARVSNRKSPPGEGPALLQGIVVCGICGAHMSVRYHFRRGGLKPDYTCDGPIYKEGGRRCTHIPGDTIEQAISDLMIEAVTPSALEVALIVQGEVQKRIDEVDQLRNKHIEHAKYEADLARQRFMQIHPDNRLVADELEADWNEKLRTLRKAHEEYKRHDKSDQRILTEENRVRILGLARDFPQLWNNPETSFREKKRMVRLILEDVTLKKGEDLISLDIRFKGGATKSITVPRPKSACEEWKTEPQLLKEIDHLMEHHTNGQIAEILNSRGLRSGTGKLFNGHRINRIRKYYQLKHRFDRLREQGLLTLGEIAEILGVCTATIRIRRAADLLPVKAIQLDDTGAYMYESPNKTRHQKERSLSTKAKEV